MAAGLVYCACRCQRVGSAQVIAGENYNFAGAFAVDSEDFCSRLLADKADEMRAPPAALTFLVCVEVFGLAGRAY
ncbi:MAG: hypothetical protein K2I39_06690 [Muribaculaceae bacterium]|nr:hypothetical protein [Muribaculaceae bacterium]